jgi:hypothetical protein
VYPSGCSSHYLDAGVDCYWCQDCGNWYWTGNLIDLKVFMWVFHNRWPNSNDVLRSNKIIIVFL